MGVGANTAFMEGGAILPAWAMASVAFGMMLNTVGWYTGTGPNHQKMDPYYEAEMDLLATNNEKLVSNSSKRWAWFTRTAHDLNGLGGTFLSGALLVAAMVGYAFSPQIASILFVASRASALISAIFTWGTNQHRLWAYRKTLDVQMNKYYDNKRTKDAKRDEFIEDVVNSAFTNVGIDRGHRYSPWVYFRSYKALDAYIGDTADKTSLVDALTAALKTFVKGTSSIFDRNKFRKIQGPSQDPIAVLDSMPLVEKYLFEKISHTVDEEEYHQISEPIDGYLQENTLAPHGTPFLPDYFTNKIAREAYSRS